MAGVSRYLKERDESVRIVLADPPGSVLYSFISSGGKRMERSGGSITEGIGQGRVTDNLQGTVVDEALHIPDEETIAMVFHLLHHDGIYIGASSALNVVRLERSAAGQLPRRISNTDCRATAGGCTQGGAATGARAPRCNRDLRCVAVSRAFSPSTNAPDLDTCPLACHAPITADFPTTRAQTAPTGTRAASFPARGWSRRACTTRCRRSAATSLP